jgi:hypothetical protein
LAASNPQLIMTNCGSFLKILAAFAAGTVTAGYFLSGPVKLANMPPPARPAAQTPSKAQAAPAPLAAAAGATQQERVRVIPIDRSRMPETTGAAAAEVDQPRERESKRTSPQPQCDRRACSRAYRSFDASSCTYQPNSGGPRRLCDR